MVRVSGPEFVGADSVPRLLLVGQDDEEEMVARAEVRKGFGCARRREQIQVGKRPVQPEGVSALFGKCFPRCLKPVSITRALKS